jgi:putative oxidoreductase
MESRWHNLIGSFGLLILRLGVGGFMACHGWGKLQMMLAGDFDKFGDPIGLGSGLSLVFMVLAEFFCALLVMIGLATRLAAVPIVFGMGVAAFVVHGNDPWTMQQAGPSKEPALLFLIPFLALVFTGAGQLSVDNWIWRRWRERRAQPKAPGQ